MSCRGYRLNLGILICSYYGISSKVIETTLHIRVQEWLYHRQSERACRLIIQRCRPLTDCVTVTNGTCQRTIYDLFQYSKHTGIVRTEPRSASTAASTPANAASSQSNTDHIAPTIKQAQPLRCIQVRPLQARCRLPRASHERYLSSRRSILGCFRLSSRREQPIFAPAAVAQSALGLGLFDIDVNENLTTANTVNTAHHPYLSVHRPICLIQLNVHYTPPPPWISTTHPQIPKRKS